MESRFETPLDDMNIQESQKQLIKPIWVTWHLWVWMECLNFSILLQKMGCVAKDILRIHQRHVYKAFRQLQFARITTEREEAENDDPDLNLSIISFESDDKRSSYQNLIWHVLQLIEQRRYRKLGEYLCKKL